jgi:hypothetical protein
VANCSFPRNLGADPRGGRRQNDWTSHRAKARITLAAGKPVGAEPHARGWSSHAPPWWNTAATRGKSTGWHQTTDSDGHSAVDSRASSNARTETPQPQAVISMGDKSPKAKDKAKKQDTADKNQKKAAAVAKASQGSAGAANKGK